MAWSAVQLRPGVDTQLTQSANQAGVWQSQLIRYKEGLIQAYGGWQNFVGFTIPSTVRELHPWQDINGTKHLGVGATGNLMVITAGSNQDITPQTNTTNPTPLISVSSGSSLATIVDAGSSATTFNTVFFNTQVAIGQFLLSGAYPINSVLGSSIYTISLPAVSSTTITSTSMANFGLPVFSISSGTGTVTVTLKNHNYQSIVGLFQQFIAPTTVGSSGAPPTIISGKYGITSVIDSTSFTINAVTAASTTATATMNSSLLQLVYYITLGPAVAGSGFGAGGFGSGGFGTGSGSVGQPGTPITTTDWTLDNWGEVLLACPKDGPIYVWSNDFGFQNAQVINQAPFFNGGIFVSMPQQILVAWKSVQATGVQDPLIVRWSNASDYTNWTVSNQTTAGSFHFSSGSFIVGGMQCPNYGLISTDIEVWTMSYVGGTVIFNFTKVGVGCGWLGPHACGVLSGTPYWVSNNNFFTLGQNGAIPLPCSVWDQIFQNLSSNFSSKARIAVNSAFNEFACLYPSASSTGENDSYVKAHIEGAEYEWDYGTLSRTAWYDVSILGMPLGVDSSGQIYQHETGTAIAGAGLPSFQTGWWTIGEGQEIPFVDFVIPDFIWGIRSGAQTASVNITFFGANYPGDTPVAYGPYTVTQSTEFISLRFRFRLMSALVQSSVSSEFWRLGRVRFRYAQSGRR